MASNVNETHTHDVDADVAAVMEEMEVQARDGKRHSRAADVFPQEPEVMAPTEEYQLSAAGRRQRIAEIIRLVRKYQVWNNLTPVRLRCLIEELGPMFVKMGQILANRSEILPQPFCDELRRLRSDVDPVPYQVVLECLEAEYGQELGTIFDAIDPNPLGSASLAQVHRARLATGEDVAVKVQRPGAQQVMAQDIDIMRSIVRHASKFVKTDQFVDLKGVVEELWQSFREETNFLMEARNLDDFYAYHKNTRGISCPRSYLKFCTEHVVVMDYIDGISIGDPDRLRAEGYDLEKIGGQIVEDYSTQVLDDGFFHADPHPGNILVKDGKVIYIDLGIMGRLSVRDRGGFKRIVEAVGSKNSAELKDALITFSVAHDMNAIDHPRFLAELDNVLESYGSTDVADIDIGALLGDIMVLTRQCKVTLPASVTAVSRGIITMEGSLQDCLANANIVDIINGHLQRSKNIKTEIENQTRDLLISLNSATHSLIKAAEYSGDTLHMLSRGQLKVNMEMLSSPEPLYKVGRIMNRLAMSLVIAGLLVSGSLIIAVDMPRLFGMPVLSLVEHVSAFVLSVWLVWDMFRRTR